MLFTVITSINGQKQTSSPNERPEMPIRKLIEVIEKKVTDNSEQNQDELLAKERKVKLTRGRQKAE